MSQTFTITWVGDRTRDWEANGRKFTAYKIALSGYDPSESDPEAGKTVEWSRHSDAPAPAPGDEVFGGVQVKQYDWGNKYVFKTEQAQGDGPPPSFKKASNGSTTDVYNIEQPKDSDWWYAKDRRISRAGVLQAVVASGRVALGVSREGIEEYVNNVNKLTDALLASLDERTPHPSAPKEEDMVVAQASEDVPKYEDVTPKPSAPLADDDSVPF